MHIKLLKRVVLSTLVITLMFSTVNATQIVDNDTKDSTILEDFDPDVNIVVTFELQKIRSLEYKNFQHWAFETIDFFSKPDFYVKVFINDKVETSTVWRNTRYVNNPDWSVTYDAPDDVEFVNIKIQLWDKNPGVDRLCDISPNNPNSDTLRDNYDVELTYSIKTGHWCGDDYVENEATGRDPSGYGRLNGCDDGSIYERDRDCELWFDIYQNDYDGDRIPYWSEVNVFGTDPHVDDTGRDDDEDNVPIEWENRWGHLFWYDWHDDTYGHEWFYSPFEYNDHANLDPDNDGLDNYEEYLTSQWGSDPFRRDVFVELDQMEESPDGQESILSEGAIELLNTAFDVQNIVLHIDDGCMGGSDIIPFDEETPQEELQDIYWNYFLHGDENNWRRGVFHYGIVAYDATFSGFVFWGGVGPYLDSLQISSSWVEKNVFPKTQHRRDIAYASVYMHELGHTFGFNPIGGHDRNSYYPWQKNYWVWGPYKSCMNYRYTYRLVDYSDGSRGKNDFDDWTRLDLTYFQRELF